MARGNGFKEKKSVAIFEILLQEGTAKNTGLPPSDPGPGWRLSGCSITEITRGPFAFVLAYGLVVSQPEQ